MRNLVLAAACLWLAACGPSLPKLPEIDFSPHPPAVRTAVEQAHSDAEFAPGDAIRVSQLAKVLHAHGFNDAAIVYYKHARQLAPENPAYTHLLGVAALERGDYPLAMEALTATMTRNPDSLATKLAMAQAQLAAGATVEAGSAFRAIGNHPVALFGLGQTLQGTEQLEAYRKAVALEPRYGTAWKALADAYRLRGNAEKATEAERAQARHLKFVPSTGDTELAAVRELNVSQTGLLARADRAEAETRLLDAAKLYEQASAADPNDDLLSAKLARVYVRLKDYVSAEKTMQAALIRKPDSPSLATAQGLLLSATQRRPEAKTFFEKASALDANQAEAWYQLGLYAEEEGAAQKALDNYARAVHADPTHRLARFHAATILAANRKPEQAREQFEWTAQGPEDELAAKSRQALAALR